MMRRALELAAKGMYTTTPNPRVGCVVTRGETVIGEGWHERAGGAHAEVLALRGVDAAGDTVYVNLEPFNHQGRTPPCVPVLVQAKVARVVAAMRDPNRDAAGGGEALAAAGIRFEHGLLEDEARELNIGFVSRMTRGRPWVRMKIAATLDGRTALDDGRSQWITGPEARRDGHRWRARASAILTGIGTVRADDPQLTVRDVERAREPALQPMRQHLAREHHVACEHAELRPRGQVPGQFAARLKKQAFVAAGDRMAHPVRLARLEEQRMARIGNHALVATSVFHEQPAQRQR